MNIIFAGTPAIAVPVLKKLALVYNVCAVLSAPDAVSGRGRKISLSAVKEAAIDLQIPVITPEKLDASAREKVASFKPDLLVCFAYRKIFGPRFMSLFPSGGLNIHPSLLPVYRGPSPINAAILNRDKATGICVQTIKQAMDTGNIIKSIEIQLDYSETTEILANRISVKAAEIVADAVEIYLNGETGIVQDESRATYCSILSKKDGLLDWRKDVCSIEAAVRAYNPWPRTFTFFNSKRLSIISSSVYDTEKNNNHPGIVLGLDKKAGILIQTGKGILAVDNLQIEGKKAMDWKAFMNGHENILQSVLGEEN